MTKKARKFDVNTILLVVILLMSLMNGCNSCSNKNSILKNSNKITKVITKLDSMEEIARRDFNQMGEYYGLTLEAIEDNAELVLILEKEIDDRKIKSSGIKTLINEYRK